MSAPLEIHELVIEAHVTSAPPQSAAAAMPATRPTLSHSALLREHAVLIDTIARLVRQQLCDDKEL